MRVSEYIKLHHLNNRHDIKLVLSGDELGWADKLSDKICEIGGNIYLDSPRQTGKSTALTIAATRSVADSSNSIKNIIVVCETLLPPITYESIINDYAIRHDVGELRFEFSMIMATLTVRFVQLDASITFIKGSVFSRGFLQMMRGVRVDYIFFDDCTTRTIMENIIKRFADIPCVIAETSEGKGHREIVKQFMERHGTVNISVGMNHLAASPLPSRILMPSVRTFI